MAVVTFGSSCGEERCDESSTRCDGAAAITCELTLCAIGPCPTSLVEEECTSEQQCVVDDESGFPRARCVNDG